MVKKKYKKSLLVLLGIIVLIVILFNIVIIMQAYSMSHFKDNARPLTEDYSPTIFESVKIAFCGLDLPRPVTRRYPIQSYDSLFIPMQGDKKLDAWLLRTDSLKHGLVIAFHGYMDEKSSMLDRADVFLSMGYDVLLVNFMGAGDSYGNQTTMGYLEAENVKVAHDYAIKELQEDNVVLIGFSMGAAAIMKAQSEYNLLVKGIILEAPYGKFTETVDSRVKRFHIPSFPITDIFTFWFGQINGLDAFNANPQDYGIKIHVPTLLMCGGKDPNISKEETHRIFDMLGSEYKVIEIFEESLHESYLLKYPDEWNSVVSSFLHSLEEMDVYNEN